MPATLEVFDRWRSSTPSLSSPILFEMCSKEESDQQVAIRTNNTTTRKQTNIRFIVDNPQIISATSINSGNRGDGAWQGGDYQDYLLDESCDSSIGAWSEDGHKEHIDNKKKMKENQKRKRSSAIVYGSLITPKVDHLTPTAALRTVQSSHYSSTQLPRSMQVNHSPAQVSETFSSPFASPLRQFPSTPARGSAGRLVELSSPSQSPITPKGYFQHAIRPPQQERLVIKNSTPLLRTVSQSIVDDSPLDTPAIVASGWTVQKDQDVGDQSPSVLIDSLLQGVQEGMISDDFVDSPRGLSSASSAQSGWETEDCEMTPRLRAKWEDRSPVGEQTKKKARRESQESMQEREQIDGNLSAKTPTGRQLSFIRVPSAIFPHTPAVTKRRSIAEKRISVASSSSSGSSSRRSSRNIKRLRGESRESMLSSTSSTRRRRSAHVVSTPRPLSRKSKYYSRPAQPGVMPAIVQQHLQGARGRFWSPMNNAKVKQDNGNLGEAGVRKSTRYSRRSGQDWIRPRTFEVKDQLRVTIYPPQIEKCHEVKTLQALGNDSYVKDPDKTPTQAQFSKVPITTTIQSHIPRPLSRASKSSHGLPTQPPPTTSLPPVPILNYAPKKKTEARRSRQSRLHLSQSTSTCLTCQSSSCSCSQSWTETICSDSPGTESAYTGMDECSCLDSSTCTCICTNTRSIGYSSTERSSIFLADRTTGSGDKISQVLGIPRSAPLFASPSVMTSSSFVPPHSAPYYSSQHPPVLSLPQLSPFYIDFGNIFGSGRRTSVRMSRNSIYTTTSCSYTDTTHSDCTTCFKEGNFATDVSQKGYSTSYGDSSSNDEFSDSYDSATKSLSSRASDDDGYSYDSGTESEMPLTPPRSEYQSSLGYLESPGYRVSCIVSPMPQSAKRLSQLQDLLMTSPPSVVQLHQNKYQSTISDEGSISQFTHSTTSSSHASTNVTFSPNGKHRIPRSILKTSKYPIYSDKEPPFPRYSMVGVGIPKKTTMAANTLSNSVTNYSHNSGAFSSNAGHGGNTAPQRATLATSTLTKCDLESRIQREELRKKRNESRLFALEKLEGKKKKSSLFFSLLSNSTASAASGGCGGGGIGGIGLREWEEDENTSPLPSTPLTPTKRHLLELHHQLEKRQRLTQFQNNKAVSFTDVVGFDMGTYPKIGGGKKGKNATSSDDDSDLSDVVLKHQLKKLSTAIEARQLAKDNYIDK